MKICFINPCIGTTPGGSESIIYQFANYLKKNGHHITIITGKSKKKKPLSHIENGPFELVTVPFLPRNTPLNDVFSSFPSLFSYKTESVSFFVNTLFRGDVILKIKEMDVVSMHYRNDSLYFSNLAYRLGVPSVFHILGGPYGSGFFKKDKSILYVANSQYSRDIIEKYDKVKIPHVVTPGVPPSEYCRNIPIIPEMKKGLSLLFAARLSEAKGALRLIEIFSQLSQKYEDLKLWIIGEGEMRKTVEQRLHELGLQSMVKFLGILGHDRVFSHYKSATLFVHPTDYESFGMAPLEAMSCGTPVVASDLPALRESTGCNAVLLPWNETNLWIEKIDLLLKDGKLRNELAGKGLEWTRQFAWEKKAKEYENCLCEAVETFKR